MFNVPHFLRRTGSPSAETCCLIPAAAEKRVFAADVKSDAEIRPGPIRNAFQSVFKGLIASRAGFQENDWHRRTLNMRLSHACSTAKYHCGRIVTAN
jgi:hypothetical protein